MNFEESNELARRQQELWGDMARLRGYGADHPDAWGGLWFEGPRLVVGFTDSAAHEDAVRSLVDHPDRLDIAVVPYSQAELEAVRDSVDAALQEVPGSWWSVGMSASEVEVVLSGSGLALAERFHALYGSRVRLTVAGHDFPFAADALHETPAPGPESTVPWPDGLHCQLVLDGQPVSGGGITGRLVLTAVGQPVRLRTTGQPFHAVLLDEVGHLAGQHLTSRSGTGLSVDLAPGEQRSVVVHAGTDSADLRRGTVVPPGTWHLAVLIEVAEEAAPGHPGRLVAGPFPIVLE